MINISIFLTEDIIDWLNWVLAVVNFRDFYRPINVFALFKILRSKTARTDILCEQMKTNLFLTHTHTRARTQTYKRTRTNEYYILEEQLQIIYTVFYPLY